MLFHGTLINSIIQSTWYGIFALLYITYLCNAYLNHIYLKLKSSPMVSHLLKEFYLSHLLSRAKYLEQGNICFCLIFDRYYQLK